MYALVSSNGISIFETDGVSDFEIGDEPDGRKPPGRFEHQREHGTPASLARTVK